MFRTLCLHPIWTKKTKNMLVCFIESSKMLTMINMWPATGRWPVKGYTKSAGTGSSSCVTLVRTSARRISSLLILVTGKKKKKRTQTVYTDCTPFPHFIFSPIGYRQHRRASLLKLHLTLHGKQWLSWLDVNCQNWNSCTIKALKITLRKASIFSSLLANCQRDKACDAHHSVRRRVHPCHKKIYCI